VTRDKEIIDDDYYYYYYYYYYLHHSVPHKCAGITAIRPTADTTQDVRKIHK
jgi:hypothetical protein